MNGVLKSRLVPAVLPRSGAGGRKGLHLFQKSGRIHAGPVRAETGGTLFRL